MNLPSKLIPRASFAFAWVLSAIFCLPVPANAADRPSFAARRVFNAGSYPWAVAVGDFNNDGISDLAAVNFISGGISVLLGNGDGTFQPAVS